MLKVLYIHHCSSRGGSSNSLFNLLKHLPDGVVEKHILTVDGPVVDLFRAITENLYVVDKIPQIGTTAGADHQLLRNLFGQLGLLTVQKIEGILKKLQPDIVHLNEITSIQLAKLCKKYSCKVVCHIRVVPDHRYRLINSYVRYLLGKYVDEAIGIDNSVAHAYRSLGINVVYNPLPSNSNVKFTVRHQEDRVNCVFLSNLLKHKGVYEVAEAAHLLRSYRNIHFLVAGGNTRSSTFYRSIRGRIERALGLNRDFERYLKRYKEKKGLTNLHILGHVSDIESVLKESHVLLFPSYMNEPSRSVFEAGIFGIPSIVAMRDRIEDVVEDSVTGYIVPEKNSKVLADKILKIASDKELRIRMGSAARKRFLLLNNGNTAASKVLSIYRSVVKPIK